MTIRRAFLIGFAAVVGGVMAASLGAFAIPDARSIGSQPRVAEKAAGQPLAATLRALSGSRSSEDHVPPAIAGELRAMAGSAPADVPARLRPGRLLFAESRLLLSGLGPSDARLYAVPTATGKVCLALSGGPSGCEAGFTVSPIGWTSFDPDSVGVGEPFTVFGLVPDSVTRIDVVERGVPRRALLDNNAFFYRLGDSAVRPEAIIITFDDGSTDTIDVSFRLPSVPPPG